MFRAPTAPQKGQENVTVHQIHESSTSSELALLGGVRHPCAWGAGTKNTLKDQELEHSRAEETAGIHSQEFGSVKCHQSNDPQKCGVCQSSEPQEWREISFSSVRSKARGLVRSTHLTNKTKLVVRWKMDEKGLSLDCLHLKKKVFVESPKNQLLLVTLLSPWARPAPGVLLSDIQGTALSWRENLPIKHRLITFPPYIIPAQVSGSHLEKKRLGVLSLANNESSRSWFRRMRRPRNKEKTEVNESVEIINEKKNPK